jgi:hypothetical protein
VVLWLHLNRISRHTKHWSNLKSLVQHCCLRLVNNNGIDLCKHSQNMART